MSIFSNEKFVVANLKQSGSLKFFKEWIDSFKRELETLGDLKINIIICPPFPFLDLFNKELLSDHKINKKRIFIGAQNVSSHGNLENTGEVSAQSISDLVNFSIIGHSERKENFDEVTRKFNQCLESKIVPIVCFYENMSVYQLGEAIYAYEDPSAISREGVYKSKDFDDLIKIIDRLKELFDSKKVLYGGSINPENASMIKDLNFFSGVLVGRASLEPEKFLKIVKVFNN
jgi:triosephosphate isomerase (TIM)